mmetsp:Transcript_21316/g.53771  ORF Transcript_21316/g.53771 Transcript_21316/m.53771 type:complete len:326 (-) Transcript_21316:427-1404(-)
MEYSDCFTLAVLLGGGLVCALYYFQNYLLYFPGIPAGSRKDFLSPASYGLQEFWEEVFITTSDQVKIQLWVFRKKSSKNHPTVIFFTGNAGNISYRLDNIRGLFAFVGVNVVIVSYRGYGKSEGTPSEQGLNLDAQAALDFVLAHPEFSSESIFLFGRSLGGAVAVHLAVNNQSKIRGLIVENTFTSIANMIEVVFPYLRIVKVLATNRWENDAKIQQLQPNMPVLFLAGMQDEIVPVSQMHKLHELCSSNKKEWNAFRRGMHMDVWCQPNYYHVFKKFVSSALGSPFDESPQVVAEAVSPDMPVRYSHSIIPNIASTPLSGGGQ